MNKSTIYDISEAIIFGESMGNSLPTPQYQDNVKILEKYNKCMEKYKQHQTCKYLLNKLFPKKF